MSAKRFAAVPAWFAAVLAVGLLVGGLLVGFEPVGGDPDRMYRPIKGELLRALSAGRLPFWSDRFGLGVPLVAESHAASFYPLNWLLYCGRVFDLGAGYRLAMWLHYVALAASMYAYGRTLRLEPWGAALAALAFTFCGMGAIQSSHEWYYHTLPYLPLLLLATERFAAGGSLVWLPAIALGWGAQLTLGHFQVQAWTGILVLVTGCWRLGARRGARWRLVALVVALAWGVAIAAVQLLLTAELARLADANRSNVGDLAHFFYPPPHLAEVVIPELFRGLLGGPEGPYWYDKGTTGYESAFYVGTIPLILACVGFVASRKERPLAPWRVLIVPLSLLLASLPYLLLKFVPPRLLGACSWLLAVPGLGIFRVPSRWMTVASLGVCLLAGRGFDRAIEPRRARLGLALALVCATAATVWAIFWANHDSKLRESFGAWGLWLRLGEAALGWTVSLVLLWRWRRKQLSPLWPFLAVALELGFLYYRGTTDWGWSARLPEQSPVLTKLAAESSSAGRVAGVLNDLPVRAGCAPLFPYVSAMLPPQDRVAELINEKSWSNDPLVQRLLRRFGTTHGVWDRPVALPNLDIVYRGPDPVLDRLAYRPFGSPAHAIWTLAKYRDPFPPARIARLAREVPNRDALLSQLTSSDARDEVWHLPADRPPPAPVPLATAPRLLRWGGATAEVEHDGSCYLVINRTFYPGWLAHRREHSGSGPTITPLPIFRVDGGLQAVRITGQGPSRVELRYVPTRLAMGLRISAVATGLALTLTAIGLLTRRRKGAAVQPTPRSEPAKGCA